MMKTDRLTRWVLLGVVASILLLLNACGVDDGLGKEGQTEEEFFTVIEAPADLQVTGQGGTSLSLAWTDMSTDEEGFAIFRREDSAADYTPAAVVGADTTTYTDSGLTNGTTYHYYLRALRGPFISDATDPATGTTLSTPPPAPASLTPTVLSDASIIVIWPDVVDETNYTIEYSDETNNPGVWIATAPVPENTVAYVFNTFAASTTYAFRIMASNDVGGSAYTYSTPATATTDAGPPPIPAAPTGLIAQTQAYLDVRLDWTDNSSYEEEYIIKRGGVEIARVVADATSYIDYNISPGTFTYSVSAVNSSGESSSDTDTVTMPSAPTAPSSLSIIPHPFLRDTYSLGWADNSGNEEGFRIYAWDMACTLVGRTKPVLLSTEPANDTSYSVSSRSFSGTVCVYVQAFNDGGTGSSSKYQYTFK